LGCEGSGFFLFGLRQAPQCDQLNGQIQRMRANLDRVMADLQQLRGGPGNADGQRRAILTALGQYNCGPQYRVAAPAPPPQSTFLESLFGGGGSSSGPAPDQNAAFPGSTYRTVCVRTCDGFFFPISNATSPGRFADDERTCQRLCPAAEAVLYSYRNGEDVSQAVSVSGRPYTELPNAFRYRQEFSPACSCKRVGESWADALKGADDRTIVPGDIVVTEEKAKLLSQPKSDTPGQPAAKQSTRKGSTKSQAPTTEGSPTPAANPQATVATQPLLPPSAISPSATAPEPASAATPPAKRNVRSVGPQFIPTR
jgi:hypothetical protein